MMNISISEIQKVIVKLDQLLSQVGELFLHLANFCLLMMTIGTSLTIGLRPFGISIYWIWPWTMVFFVWMTFFGFFAVYNSRKDIVIDFITKKLGPLTGRVVSIISPLSILLVTGTIILEIPKVIDAQDGVIDGALLPWGEELNRWLLTVPLAASCLLILVQSMFDLLLGRTRGVDSVTAALNTEIK